MQADGHLAFLSREGIKHLSLKLLKYLDYAVNIRSGSEVIYHTNHGFIHGDSLEKLLRYPDRFEGVLKPLYLTIETGEMSVIFDTQDHRPAAIYKLMAKAEQLARQRPRV